MKILWECPYHSDFLEINNKGKLADPHPINGLSIININKGSPQGVGGQQNSTDASSGQGTDGQNFIYFKIPVQYEIKGNFLGYLKFRRALASSAKVINFDKEEINVEKEAQGHIVSKGTISIVGLPDEYK